MNFLRVLIPSHFILLQAAEYQVAEVFGNLSIELLGVVGNLALVFHTYSKRRIPLKRHTPRHHLVKDDSQRIYIRPLVNLFPLHLLWTHIFRRADHDPGTRDSLDRYGPGYPEIHDLGIALLVNHDIAG